MALAIPMPPGFIPTPGMPGGGGGGGGGNPDATDTQHEQRPREGLPGMPSIPDVPAIPPAVPPGSLPWLPPLPELPPATPATPDAGGGGGGMPAPDWGPTNSRFDQPTPDGGPYNYERKGHTSASGASYWTVEIRNAGLLKYSRTWEMPLGVSVYIDGVSTFQNSYGYTIVNPIIIRQSAITPNSPNSELDRPGSEGTYGMEVHALGISITARPKNPYDDTNPVSTGGSTAPPGWAPPVDFPEIPAPAPDLQPLPQPKPSTAPAVPDAQPAPATTPSPQPSTNPAAPPATTPATRPAVAPPVPAPRPAGVPGARPVTPNGLPGSVGQAKPTPTPTGNEVAGPAGAPVTVTDPQIRPTLDGIATEVGRIENKLRAVLDRPEIPEPDWAALLEEIRKLLEPEPVPFPAASYQIQPPCGSGPDGGPPAPVVVPVAATADPTEAVLLRLDALAELLNVHKRIRQPICKGRTTGEPVTVTFERVG